jgi:SAM-dependent methyltransferase
MRHVKSHYLNDGKLFNDGRPVDLLHIESEKDYDLLWDNILRSNYYDGSYFNNYIQYKDEKVKFDSFFLSAILKYLKPKSLLELGCARGDVLFLTGLDPRIKVRGIEFSRDVLQTLWPSLSDKVLFGDILEISNQYSGRMTFDTFCAFDLWEHIPPGKLHDYIDAVLALAEKDAFLFFTLPAFGEDKVFGEIFPLEFEENRINFDCRLPFEFLIAESLDPPIPALGHLIWAHTDWWQSQFERHGLIREEGLERDLHAYFDEHLFYARKNFFLFRLDTPAARLRVRERVRQHLTPFRKWKLMNDLEAIIRAHIETEGKSIIDLEELTRVVTYAKNNFYVDAIERVKGWSGHSQALRIPGAHHLLTPSILERLTAKSLNIFFKVTGKG